MTGWRTELRKLTMPNDRDTVVIDKLNVSFKMFDIEGVTAYFACVEKGSTRPFRIKITGRARMIPKHMIPNYRERVKYFDDSEDMAKWAQKHLIAYAQAKLLHEETA